MDQAEEIISEVIHTATETATQVDDDSMGKYFASFMLLLGALLPIWIGAHRSLGRNDEVDENGKKKEAPKDEVMSAKDAYMFPLIGSCVLFGLYMLFKLFHKDYINLLLTVYFLVIGEISLTATLEPLGALVSPSFLAKKKIDWTIKIPFVEEPLEIKLEGSEITSALISLVIVGFYVKTKHWMINNLFGFSFSVQAIQLLSLGSVLTGCILLGGLFFYDIFWVFATDVMVTVAKSFDAPIKLVFPKDVFAETLEFSMLGLGDIVIPGIFIALLLRFDAHRQGIKNPSKQLFAKSYFHAAFIAYIIGLVTTITVMHVFNAAQPALLYLVPACCGSCFLMAASRGEVGLMLAFSEEGADEEEEKKEKKKKK